MSDDRSRDQLSATGYTFGDAVAMSAGAFAPMLEKAGSFARILPNFDSLATGRQDAVHHSVVSDEKIATPAASIAHAVAGLALTRATAPAHDPAADSFVFHGSEHPSTHHNGTADAAGISDLASQSAHELDAASALLVEPLARVPHGDIGA